MAMLNDILVDDYLEQCVSIRGVEALEEEFISIPAQVAYWNERLARASDAYFRAEVARKRISARLHHEEKARLSVAGGKGPTVGDIDAAVELHPEMVEAGDKEIDAAVEKDRLRGVLDALRTKRDMLMQLGSKMRIEMEHDPVIRERSRVAQLERRG
jgi:hypothetical protein